MKESYVDQVYYSSKYLELVYMLFLFEGCLYVINNVKIRLNVVSFKLDYINFS
jgi:hypothetical protein